MGTGGPSAVVVNIELLDLAGSYKCLPYNNSLAIYLFCCFSLSMFYFTVKHFLKIIALPIVCKSVHHLNWTKWPKDFSLYGRQNNNPPKMFMPHRGKTQANAAIDFLISLLKIRRCIFSKFWDFHRTDVARRFISPFYIHLSTISHFSYKVPFSNAIL